MRKWTRMLLLGALFTVLLCTSALAEDVQGIHSIVNNNTGAYDVKAQKSDGTVVNTPTPVTTTDGSSISVYPDTECVKFTIKNSVEGQQYLVFVLTEQKPPTSGNIAYIDQKGTGEDLTFKLYPSSLSNEKTYYVYVSSTDNPLTAEVPVASFQYYAPYILGDPTGDNKINMKDAQTTYRHYLRKTVLTGNAFLAADVNLDKNVTIKDASMILRYYVKNLTSFS